MEIIDNIMPDGIPTLQQFFLQSNDITNCLSTINNQQRNNGIQAKLFGLNNCIVTSEFFLSPNYGYVGHFVINNK